MGWRIGRVVGHMDKVEVWDGENGWGGEYDIFFEIGG